MKRYICFSVFFFLLAFGFTQTLGAQQYKSAVGARFGSPLAISFKTFLSESSAVEAFVGYRSFSFISYVSINGAYQIHNDLGSVTEGLQWYYGGGGGVQFYSYTGIFANIDNQNSTSFSVSGYLGLDYKFVNSPVNISLDWSPTFFFGDFSDGLGFGGGFGAGNGALSVRYVLSE